MNIIDQIAEARIEEAIARGELSNLPGEGKPLELDDDRLVAVELRAAYRVLRNAGFCPPEVTLLRQIREVESLLAGMGEAPEWERRARLRLSMLLAQLDRCRGSRSPVWAEPAYQARVLARLGTRSRPTSS